ncbi:MAG: hypothetical protein QM636_14375 [Rhizobium sp.]
MNDNVIKFRRPTPPKPPRPGLRKLLVVLAILAVFAAAWGYFQLTGSPAP